MQITHLKKRRGLHTIVGAVFFVLVMGSTIGYVTYSMDLIDDLSFQIDAKQDYNLNRQSEKFKIVDVNVVNNEFNLTVKNTGTIPINVTKLWVKNMTDPLWNQTSYQINQLVSPGQNLKDIGIGTGLAAVDSESYSLKLLTGRGNSLETQVVSAANKPLEMTLVTNPINPVGGEDVTVTFTVKNNLTEGIVQSIVPVMDFDDGTSTVTQIGTVNPPSYPGLQPGETVTFEYRFDVAGDEDETAIFNATIANAVQGNFVTDTATVMVVPLSYDALESELAKSFGKLFLNYTTFEYCEPSGGGQDCTSDSNDWDTAWSVKKNRNHMYRIEVINTNDWDYWIFRETGIMMLQAGDDGNWDAGKMFFILNQTTTTNEGPIAYNDHSQKIPCCEGSTHIYFGAAKIPYDGLALTYDKNGVMAVFMLIYASEDIGNDGYNGNDPRYSQNLPFQAVQTHS